MTASRPELTTAVAAASPAGPHPRITRRFISLSHVLWTIPHGVIVEEYFRLADARVHGHFHGAVLAIRIAHSTRPPCWYGRVQPLGSPRATSYSISTSQISTISRRRISASASSGPTPVGLTSLSGPISMAG